MGDADELRRIALASQKNRAEKKSLLEDGEVLESYVEDGEIPPMILKPVPQAGPPSRKRVIFAKNLFIHPESKPLYLSHPHLA
jgi:hypothetical protein